MNIITRYEANELSKREWEADNLFAFNEVKTWYDEYQGFRDIVDTIFNKIKECSSFGEFDAQIDIRLEKKEFDNLEYYNKLGLALSRFLQHLGYIVDKNPTENGLFLWINWWDKQRS